VKKHCERCGQHRQFKPFSEGLYKSDGETVYTCKECGHLRTQNQRRIIEAEMIHRPTQKKYKEMNQE